MEAVGARLGRSSTRHGPTTAFTGPVRKWKKTWVPVKPSNTDESPQPHVAAKRTVNGSSSHLLLYQWTPITPRQNKNDATNNCSGNGNPNFGDSNEDGTAATEEPPPKRKFKYIPVVVLEEQMNEYSEQAEDDSAPVETDVMEETAKAEFANAPMDENQAQETTNAERQDLNQSTDLADSKMDPQAQNGVNESDSSQVRYCKTIS